MYALTWLLAPCIRWISSSIDCQIWGNYSANIQSYCRYQHLEAYDCNDLFSRFEKQILFLEKQAEATNPTTDRHGHDVPSHGLISKHLENLKLGTENWLSELRDGMAGRTVTGVTDRHRLFSGNWLSDPCDDLQDGPSQARRPVTGCAIPVWVGFLDTF